MKENQNLNAKKKTNTKSKLKKINSKNYLAKLTKLVYVTTSWPLSIRVAPFTKTT